MWWAARCSSKKNLMRTASSRMELDDMLKMKLETIKEEAADEDDDSNTTKAAAVAAPPANSMIMKPAKNFSSRWRIKDSYVLLMNGFASKGGLGGIPRY